MTDLSPAAQAVLDAFGKYPLHGDHIAKTLLQGALPAALRAAADQAVPHEYMVGMDVEVQARQLMRLRVLAIAAELEGQ
jgi:hypothetical protein